MTTSVAERPRVLLCSNTIVRDQYAVGEGVARLDRLKMSDAIDLREMLDRLESDPVGLVVIGTRLTGSPYYAADGSATEAPAISVG